MDLEARQQRREQARRRTRRQRHLAAGALLLALAVGIAAIASAIAGSGAPEHADRTRSPPQLPRGGRQVLPDFRVVAFYGAPQDPELGTLGIGSPTDAATVNEVSRYLSRLIRARNLPQKLLLVHRFTDDMIEDEQRLERHSGV